MATPAILRADVFQATPCHLGEGPCWHAARGTLWWIDITGRKLYEATPDGESVRQVGLPQMIGAVAPTSDGRLIAALHQGIYLVAPLNGAFEKFAEAPGHDPKTFRFNDGKVDPQGRFWAGTLPFDGRPGQSHFYRVDGKRTVTSMLNDVTISNGLAWTPDGGTLYYVDSPTRKVQAFDFEGETGMLRNRRVAFELGEGDGWPDGCCMDAEGCLWLGHWGGSKITRWEPRTGRLLATVPLPVKNVTSCAFGGPKLDQLFITTAVDDQAKTPEPEAGFVFTLDPKVTGAPLRPFAL